MFHENAKNVNNLFHAPEQELEPYPKSLRADGWLALSEEGELVLELGSEGLQGVGALLLLGEGGGGYGVEGCGLDVGMVDDGRLVEQVEQQAQAGVAGEAVWVGHQVGGEVGGEGCVAQQAMAQDVGILAPAHFASHDGGALGSERFHRVEHRRQQHRLARVAIGPKLFGQFYGVWLLGGNFGELGKVQTEDELVRAAAAPEGVGHDAGATDTDEYWLAQGYITVVPVNVDMTAHNLIASVSKDFDR